MSRQKNCKHKHVKKKSNVSMDWQRESLFPFATSQKIFLHRKLRWIFHFHYDANYRMNGTKKYMKLCVCAHISSENAKSLFRRGKNLLTLVGTWPSSGAQEILSRTVSVGKSASNSNSLIIVIKTETCLHYNRLTPFLLQVFEVINDIDVA